ncbi:MAG: type II secretion system F family protein [Candidatus Vogelbacteria bacterium]|nr:type II secretion system F family protein [Candidatus Vogelbacteria bacterium]
MKFTFKATGNTGEQSGVREAADRFALARELRAEGLMVTSAKETAAVKSKIKFSLPLFGKVKTKEKIIFASSLAAMISAGLSLSRALSVALRQTTNKKFKKTIVEVSQKISAGSSLSQALGASPDVFPPVFVAMVAAGEESGNLPQSLEIVRQQMAKSYDLQRKVKGAMIYPAVILGAIVVIAILMMMLVVPTITAVFKDFNVTLPLSTRLIIGISDFISGQPIIFVGLLLLLIGFSIWLLRTRRGKRGATYLIMHLPAISKIVKDTNAAITMRTISSLLSSGVSLIQSITITARVVQNSHYQTILTGAAEVVQKGQPLSAVFKANEKIYPILVGELTEVGEETGDLAGMLQKGATFFEEEVDQATKNLSTIIEPALMILIGIAVGFFAVSIIGPIYSLSSSM